MQVRVYLKKRDVEGSCRFKRGDGGPPQQWHGQEGWEGDTFFGLPLFRDGEEWFIIMENLTDQIPSIVENLVARIVVNDRLVPFCSRTGTFPWHSAEGEMVDLPAGERADGKSHELTVQGMSMVAVAELWGLIIRGHLVPTMDYEDPPSEPAS